MTKDVLHTMTIQALFKEEGSTTRKSRHRRLPTWLVLQNINFLNRSVMEVKYSHAQASCSTAKFGKSNHLKDVLDLSINLKSSFPPLILSYNGLFKSLSPSTNRYGPPTSDSAHCQWHATRPNTTITIIVPRLLQPASRI